MISRTMAALTALFVLAACGGGGSVAVTGRQVTPAFNRASSLAKGVLAMNVNFYREDGERGSRTVDCRGARCFIQTVEDGERYIDIDTSTFVDNRDNEPDRWSAWAVSGDYSHHVSEFWQGTGNLPGQPPYEGGFPVSFGSSSGTNPQDSASYTGSMAGLKLGGSTLGTRVTGDAALTADLSASTLGLAFTNIADNTGTGSDDIRWSGVPMRNGSFQASGLDGRFYGPSHEEAGGVFERGGIVGAFSLIRQ